MPMPVPAAEAWVPAAGGARTAAVLATAAELFEARGYATTTMTDIAQAVGILPGSLYHHFAAKEDIAVALLEAYAAALEEVGRSGRGARRPAAALDAGVRSLAAELAEVAFAHAAAVRLRAHEAPPSSATPRFVQAMSRPTPALDRACRRAVAALRPPIARPSADLRLLRVSLQSLLSAAPAHYEPTSPPRQLAGQLCDLLLHGALRTVPTAADLDRSAASEAATAAVADWGSGDSPADGGPRRQIVDAARSQFARRGYAATTIRDIARSARVPMGTLYRRVESKEALLREIIDAYAASIDVAYRAVLGAGSPPAETLDATIRLFAAASRRFPDETRILQYGWSGRKSTGSPLHDYVVATERRRLELVAVVQRGIAAGVVRPVDDPEMLAWHIRTVAWLPLHELPRQPPQGIRAFLRQALLGGVLSPG